VTSSIVDSAAIYIMVVKFRNNIWPPPPQLSLHRRALSSNSNGTRSVYNRENPKSSLYCEMSVCGTGTAVTVLKCSWLVVTMNRCALIRRKVSEPGEESLFLRLKLLALDKVFSPIYQITFFCYLSAPPHPLPSPFSPWGLYSDFSFPFSLLWGFFSSQFIYT
jgi:hypothetical protein